MGRVTWRYVGAVTVLVALAYGCGDQQTPVELNAPLDRRGHPATAADSAKHLSERAERLRAGENLFRGGARRIPIEVLAAGECYTSVHPSYNPSEAYVSLCIGDTMTVTIVSAECSGVGDILEVRGSLTVVVSNDACRDAGATVTAVATTEGLADFVLTDPRFGSGDYYITRGTQQAPEFDVWMEDGYGDGDYDDNVLLVTIKGHPYPCPPVADSLLRILAFRDSLVSLYQQTRADPNRLERAGAVYRDQLTGDIRWEQLQPQSATQCEVTPLPPAPGPNEVVVARYHSHGYAKGEAVYGCGAQQGQLFGYYNPDRYGGGSREDWLNANARGIDTYTVDGERISRLDSELTNPADWPANTNRWYWHAFGQCLTRTP